MILIFSFSINPETQEAVFAGNIEPQQALAILQNIVIAELVRRSKDNGQSDKQSNSKDFNAGGAIEEAQPAVKPD